MHYRAVLRFVEECARLLVRVFEDFLPSGVFLLDQAQALVPKGFKLLATGPSTCSAFCSSLLPHSRRKVRSTAGGRESTSAQPALRALHARVYPTRKKQSESLIIFQLIIAAQKIGIRARSRAQARMMIFLNPIPRDLCESVSRATQLVCVGGVKRFFFPQVRRHLFSTLTPDKRGCDAMQCDVHCRPAHFLGGGHLRHLDFPKTIGKSSKSTSFH